MRNETGTKIFLGRPPEIWDHLGFPKTQTLHTHEALEHLRASQRNSYHPLALDTIKLREFLVKTLTCTITVKPEHFQV